jgi:hypothetical protein
MAEKNLDTGHRTQDTGHRTQDTGHRTQDTGHRTQDTGHRTLSLYSTSDRVKPLRGLLRYFTRLTKPFIIFFYSEIEGRIYVAIYSYLYVRSIQYERRI